MVKRNEKSRIVPVSGHLPFGGQSSSDREADPSHALAVPSRHPSRGGHPRSFHGIGVDRKGGHPRRIPLCGGRPGRGLRPDCRTADRPCKERESVSVRILTGDVRTRLRDLPDASVHCVVTSPPYYGLRDYAERRIRKRFGMMLDLTVDHGIRIGSNLVEV